MSSVGEERTIRCRHDEGFASWVAQSGGSLAISTYQAGRVVMVGWDGRQVTVLPREFPKPMGLALRDGELALACRYEVVFLANASMLAAHYPRQDARQYDGLFLPRARFLTGDLHVHDLAYGDDGLWVVNTRFSCLARLSASCSFEAAWRPPFITALAPEDRCHLNGLAMLDGKPKYVTALGEVDTPGGWRPNRVAGGLIMDVSTGEIVLRGLCMPHSPRWYDEAWWVLNSGTGELWKVDPQSGTHDVACALPGYGRGLSFDGRFALVGLSKIRQTHVFDGMPVQQRVQELYCGVALVDLKLGKHVGLFEFTDGCEELYDVAFLPGLRRPSILSPEGPVPRQAVTTPEFSYWITPTEEDSGPGAGQAGAKGL